MSMLDAFRRADDVLLQAVRGISDLIVHTGVINVDFADVRTIMSGTGRALMGTGYGRGANRATAAAEAAVNSPLLDEISIEGATGILINFTAGPDIKAREIHEAASLIHEAAHEDANIIFGLVTDPNMTDVVKVTVIATGFDLQAGVPADVMPTRRTANMPHAHAGGYHAPMVRSAAQETMSRASTMASRTSSSAPPSQIAMPRRSVEIPSQATIAASNAAHRAFGAAAMHDEATLDIPAYLRRTRP
jgi:cell division protein FtsZ